LLDPHLTQLHLEKGKLHKQSYVRLQHVYEVKMESLHRYKWRNSLPSKHRLCKESYDLLIEKLGIEGEEFVETSMVNRVMRSRLSKELERCRTLAVMPERMTVRQQLPVLSPARTFVPPSYPQDIENHEIRVDEPRWVQQVGHAEVERVVMWNQPQYNTWPSVNETPVPETEESEGTWNTGVFWTLIVAACYVVWKWW
jgi:hypothetical protein